MSVFLEEVLNCMQFGSDIVSPRNDRSCTHEVSPTWLPKHDLKMNMTTDMLTQKRASLIPRQRELHQGTKDYAGIGRNSLSWERIHQFVIQYQMESSENKLTHNIILTEQVIFMC